MRIVINLLLTIAIFVLGYLTYASIRAPINFKSELNKRESAIIQKLMTIRKAQEVYRDVTGGNFADSWDKLKDTLAQGKIRFISIKGDPDDPNFDISKIERDTTYKPAIDTIRAMGINLDSLGLIPYGEGKLFDINSDTLTYQSTKVNVVEVSTTYDQFMGIYASPAYSQYDKRYNPKKKIRFGDMTKPTMAGSWDR